MFLKYDLLSIALAIIVENSVDMNKVLDAIRKRGVPNDVRDRSRQLGSVCLCVAQFFVYEIDCVLEHISVIIDLLVDDKPFGRLAAEIPFSRERNLIIQVCFCMSKKNSLHAILLLVAG